MSEFSERMATDPPRLVVIYRQGPDGNDQYQWGVVGAMPVMSLVGGIVRAQADLLSGAEMVSLHGEGDGVQQPFVLAWDATECELRTYLHPSVPRLSLVGMLELIKATLVGGQVAQRLAAQQVQQSQQVQAARRTIVGPNGRPLR